MDLKNELVQEFEMEAQTTRKMLTLVPADKFDWTPHEKSMSMKSLSVHIAEIAGWPEIMLNTPELDFATMGYTPSEVSSTEELLSLFESEKEKGINAIRNVDVKVFDEQWLLRSGDTIHMTFNKWQALRHSYSQIIHHRAQLGLYLRLLNIPIPGSYGPSADEMQGFA